MHRPTIVALIASLVVTVGAAQEHPASAPPQVAFWIPNAFTNSILGYAATADGDASPLRTITGDRTGLAAPSAVAVDARGMLYVANAGNNSVTIYPPEASGNMAPVRILRGSSTGLANPRALAVDAAGAIYVANSSRSRVTVYAPGADGDVWPIRSIWGSRTALFDVHGIAVDRTGAVYVASLAWWRIDVFAPGADGNVRSARAIRGRRQSSPVLTQPLALALGRDDRLYVTTGVSDNAVMVFGRGARGFARPERTIAGTRTGLNSPMGIVVDRRGRIAVLNWGPQLTVTVYDRGARGDARPIQTITGPATGLMLPDSVHHRPAVRLTKPPSVTVYAPGAAGDIPPSRTIAGERTLLLTPVSLALARDTTLYVLSCQGRLTAYAPGADGDAAPTRVPAGRGLRPALSFGVAMGEEDTVYVSHNTLSRGGHGYLFVYASGSPSDTTPVRVIQGVRVGLTGLARDAGGLLYRGKWSGFDVVDPGASGERPPIRELAGSESEFFFPGSFAIDSRGRLYVPNGDDAVRIYDGHATGDLRPRHTITGRRTGLDQPVAAALGPGDTLFVANAGIARGPSVTVYRPGAASNAKPVRVLRGERTGLASLSALAVDAAGTLYVVNNPEGRDGCEPDRS